MAESPEDLHGEVHRLAIALATQLERAHQAELKQAVARQITWPMAFSALGALALLFAGMTWMVSAIVQPVSARVDVVNAEMLAVQNLAVDNRQRQSDQQAILAKLTSDQREQCTNFEDQLRALNSLMNSSNKNTMLREALAYQDKNHQAFPIINFDEEIANSEHCH